VQQAAASQAGHSRDRGVTVVEMLVSTMILAVGVLAVVGSLRAGTAASAVAEHRLVAARLATSELDAIRSLVITSIGIDPTSVGYTVSYEGRPTVTESTNLVAPTGTTTRAGIDYRLERYVTWESVTAASGTFSEAYKHVTVLVGWTDEVGDHELRQDTGLILSALDAT
jgi:Tfp pilus assembly protein PilV